MASKLLCPENVEPNNFSVGLILSSTWDYSPQSSRRLSDLSDFVFIILPGCEAANPLLIPLAGHELGHAVWERETVASRFWDDYPNTIAQFLMEHRKAFPDVDQDIGDLQNLDDIRDQLEATINTTYSEACRLVAAQLEEFFCDFIGFYLFGESFVHAFTYFLSPDFPSARSQKYPTVRTRLVELSRAQKRFARKWGANAYPRLPDLSPQFVDRPLSKSDSKRQSVPATLARRLLYQEIDKTALALTPRLLNEIVRLAARPGWADLRSFDNDERKRIRDTFRWAVPAENSQTLANILNAGWDAARDQHFWSNHPSLGSDEGDDQHDPKRIFKIREKRREALYELLLKNIEVSEYEYIVSQPLTDDQAR